MNDQLLYNYDQAGELLSVSKRTVRRLVADGKLAVVFPSPGSPRISAAELAGYVERLESRADKGKTTL